MPTADRPASTETALATADAAALLKIVSRVEAAASEIAERRLLFVRELAALLDSDACHWSWGRGHPVRSTIAPMALVDHGYTEDQIARMTEWALAEETNRAFQQRVVAKFHDAPQMSTLRGDVFDDDEWATVPAFRAFAQRIGMDAWMQTVIYESDDTWSTFFMFRALGKPDFTRRELTLLALAMDGISWLHAKVEEKLPREAFIDLSARQRTVMLLLLDGASRKQIASRLKLSEHTVGDHVKSIYNHFQVHSVGELAAKFMRGS